MLSKNLLRIVVIPSILIPTVLLAQDSQPTGVSATGAERVAQAAAPAPAKAPASRVEETVFPGLEHFKGLVILGSTNDFKPEGVSGVNGVLIKGPAFLTNHQELVSKALAPFFGKPLTPTALTNIQVELILVCRRLDRPIVDVLLSERQSDHQRCHLADHGV